MALFNKLFLGLKSTTQNSNEDSNVSQKASYFTSENVRVVLFRECDFRGRKLLFDSDATEKVPIEKAQQDKKFVEVSNGYGFLIMSKQNSDYPDLSEMVFGSVAMSFRGTYFKIHSLSEPTRLMFTQVFPSPHGKIKNSSTSSCQSTQSSFEHSIKLDDSGASSIFSTSDRLSDRSTASDTVLVCRRTQSSPLDVPRVALSFSKNSFVVDSGCADQYLSSFSTGPLTFPTWESICHPKGISVTSMSSCSIFKRLLRSSTRSLKSSSISLPNSGEILHKTHHRSSKLGLTIIVEIPVGKEEFFVQLFMEHIALLEALIWRTRHSIEIAYHRPPTFISMMMDIAQNTATWLVNLVNAPRITTNLWQRLFFDCDNKTSISAFTLDGKDLTFGRTFRMNSVINNSDNSDNLGFSGSFRGLPCKSRTDLFSFNFSKFLKTDLDKNNKKIGNEGELVVDKFLREFCELLEEMDVKETNFFISTLLTAVLTHHLGWVETVFPSSPLNEETILNLKEPYNALWDQLTDLYGAVGHPVKTAQTVVTGSNKNVVSKVLNSLTYFIRFSNIEKRHIERTFVEEENTCAEKICLKNNFIPSEYYKRYEDHLKEMLTEATLVPCSSSTDEENSISTKNIQELGPQFSINFKEKKRKHENKKTLDVHKGLIKTKTQNDLSKITLEESYAFDSQQSKGPSLSKSSLSLADALKTNCLTASLPKNQEIIAFDKWSDFDKINEVNQKNNNNNLRSLSKSNNVKDFTKLDKTETACDCDISEMSAGNDCDTNEISAENDSKSKVLFVLGDNEKLVGLKKDDNCFSLRSSMEVNETNLVSGVSRKISSAKRPTSLNLTKVNYEFSSAEQSNISKSINNHRSCLVQSSSYESLCPETKDSNVIKHSELKPHSNLRAQSEPPELGKAPSGTYQYSRVKFNLQQYPQVVRNYMKSKNIELEGLSLGEKAYEKFATVQHNIKLDFSGYENDAEEVEALQTPSNASELMEFTSDMGSREDSKKASSLESSYGMENKSRLMKLIDIPMPQTTVRSPPEYSVPYTSTVIKGLVDNYIPDMVLQGIPNTNKLWYSQLKSNLAINTQHSLLDQPVEESLAIVANTDTWEVQVMSSHTYVIDKGTNGVRVGMSQMVANILETLLQMWKLHIPSQYCIRHIEQRLQELCVRSKALAQLLLASEFCSMELLTSTLHIEVNDVPLLMAVASTHSPEVTRKYGLSFQ